MNVLHRPKIVLLGMMTNMPVAGVVWQTAHYMVGLERLGYDAYYIEAQTRMPTSFMNTMDDDAAALAARFIAHTMARFGLSGRWAFHSLHDGTGNVYGMGEGELRDLYRDAALIINLHGGTIPLPEHYATNRLIYLETDPVALQIQLHDRNAETIEFLKPHCAFFTFGENYGREGCGLPVSDEFDFRPTRQPVVMDFWEAAGAANESEQAFTTIGNWEQHWRSVTFRGETYHWSKHLEFLKFLDLPRAAAGQPMELALASLSHDVRQTLQSHGWRVRLAVSFSDNPSAYRRYIGGSRGEFTVAKDQNVRLRSGWFSDRSATYLAAARPVVTQQTGFSSILPTGEGLFAFSTMDDALAAIEAINRDYARHRAAARRIAREYFSFDVVLKPLLAEMGLHGGGSRN